MKITNFEHNPILKKLLIKYVLRTYEESAITTDEHLLMEFELLIRENKLIDLFIEEKLSNYFQDGK